MYELDVDTRSDAPRERVWELLADARSWADWAAFSKAELLQEGSPTPDGIGALRRFGTGVYGSHEEVVEFEPPARLAYRLRKGLPLRDYLAVVTLAEDGDGTRIHWHSTFDGSKVPGTSRFFRWFLTRFLTDTAKRLAAAAERSS